MFDIDEWDFLPTDGSTAFAITIFASLVLIALIAIVR